MKLNETMRCVFNAPKNLQFNSIAWHRTIVFCSSISSLLFNCLIYSIEKKKHRHLVEPKYSWRNFQRITYFRLELNLTIYLTLPHGQAFSFVSSSLWFLHILNTLLSVDSNSTEFHRYYFSHGHKPWKK